MGQGQRKRILHPHTFGLKSCSDQEVYADEMMLFISASVSSS